MSAAQFERMVRRIGSLLAPDWKGHDDAELLRAFRTERDSTAFAEILQRHGRLVMAVCRRVLGNHAAAEDAWQATFLILVRRAGRIRCTTSLAGWLHGVAYRTALNERRAARRRTSHEPAARSTTVPSPDRQAALRELQAIVDVEVQRLPAYLREVFIRCALENECRADVAVGLGLNEGTVRSRLRDARRLLRDRLRRKGVDLSVALAVAAAATTQVSATLTQATIESATSLATQASRRVLLSANVAAMVYGATNLVGIARRLAIMTLFIAAGSVVVGFHMAQPDAKEPPPKKEAPIAPIPEAIQMVESDPLPAGALTRFGTTRFRTGSMISELVFSPNGKMIGCGCSDNNGQLSVWDARTGKEIWTQRLRTTSLLALAWPSDAKGIAVLRTGDLRDLTAAKPLVRPNAVEASGRQRLVANYELATVSADGKLIAAARSTGENGPQSIAIFELKSVKSIKELKVVAVCDRPPTKCLKIALTPDGKRLLGVCTAEKDGKPTGGGQIIVWTMSGKIEQTFVAPIGAHHWRGFQLGISNRFAALGLQDGSTFVVAIDTGKTRTFNTGHKAGHESSGVLAVALAPNHRTLATVGIDKMLRVSDLETEKVIYECGPHSSLPEAVAFSADGSRLVSGGQDGVIHVWDTATGKESVATGGHPYRVWNVSSSADGRTVATEGGDSNIRIWDGATGVERRQIDTGGNVAFCQITPDGRHVVAILGLGQEPKKTLKVWDVATGADTTPRGFSQKLSAREFRFTPDRTTLLTYDDKLAAWTWPGGTQIWTADMPKPAKGRGINRVGSISIAPEGRHFVTVADSGGADGVVDLWETATGKHIRRVIDSEGGCFGDEVFAAEGMLIHSGCGILSAVGPNGKAQGLPGQISMVDIASGRIVRAFSRPWAPAHGRGFPGQPLVLSGDGKALFQTIDGELRVYEVATGAIRMSLDGHRDTVLALYAPPADVRRVLSASSDTTALLWDVGFGGKKFVPVPEAERFNLWNALSNSDKDMDTAYAAMTKLAGDPATFVSLVNEKLKPAPADTTAEALAPIIRDLDSHKFATRNAAAVQLNRFGESAVPLIRVELTKATSAEVRERLFQFLNRFEEGEAEHLVQVRAVELLEHLGTAEAKVALKRLASGGSSRLTTDAASALKRLAARQ